MNIALYQYRPAIRLYKSACLLTMMGHKVTIYKASDREPVCDLMWDKFDIRNIQDLGTHDRLIAYNPGVTVPECDYPVIQYVGDITATTKPVMKEAQNLKKARKVAFVSHNQYLHARAMYNVPFSKTCIIYNALLKSMHGPHKPKQPGTMVYSGTLSDKGHRHIYNILKYYSRRYELHIYPSCIGLPDPYKSLGTCHTSVPPYELVTALSQYECGLIANASALVNKQSMPNKYFEYLAAGLEVIWDRKVSVPFLYYDDQTDKFNKLLK